MKDKFTGVNLHLGNLTDCGALKKLNKDKIKNKRAFYGEISNLNYSILENSSLFDENFQPKINVFDSRNFKAHRDYCIVLDQELNYELDEVQQNQHLFIANRAKLLKRYYLTRRANSIIEFNRLKKENKEKCNEFLEYIENGGEDLNTCEQYRKYFSRGIIEQAIFHFDIYQEDMISKVFKTTSPMYNGGCIKYKRCSSGLDVLIFCCGRNLNALTVKTINWKEQSLMSIYEEKNPLDSPIFQIEISNANFIYVRREHQIDIYKLHQSFEDYSIQVKHQFSYPSEHVWSYVKHDETDRNIAAFRNEEFQIFDSSTNQLAYSTVIKSSACDDSYKWCQIENFLDFRIWCYSDNSHSYLVDPRIDELTTLFSSGNSQLSENEKLYHMIVNLNSVYLYCFSSYSYFLIDIRMPGRMMNKHNCGLMQPVTYSNALINFDSKNQTNATDIVIGSQYACQHGVFRHFDCSGDKSDSLFNCQFGKVNLNDHSSLGVTSFIKENILSVLTLDNFGRVICHKYQTPDIHSQQTEYAEEYRDNFLADTSGSLQSTRVSRQFINSNGKLIEPKFTQLSSNQFDEISQFLMKDEN